MSQQDKSHLEQALECWDSGQPLEAGRLIYENLPPKSRPKWACRILKLVIERSGVRSSLFDDLQAAAEREDMWKSGHHLFSTLRESTLKLDEMRRKAVLSDDEKLLSSILSLAELVAKVIYNATNPQDEFDEDSGWWIAPCLRGFVDLRWRDQHFAKAAWAALGSFESKADT